MVVRGEPFDRTNGKKYGKAPPKGRFLCRGQDSAVPQKGVFVSKRSGVPSPRKGSAVSAKPKRGIRLTFCRLRAGSHRDIRPR